MKTLQRAFNLLKKNGRNSIRRYLSNIPSWTIVANNYEEWHGKIFAVFASLAISIACLGLIGLASFTAERRKKEVGIRKVLGASQTNLIVLLTKEFTLLVILAFLVASPFAWLIIRSWLQDFAYQANMGVGVFLLSGLIALLITWLTVAYQTGKTALTNPVKALRYE